MSVSNVVEFHDETLRDGPQSLWAMGLRYGMMDAVLSELDQGGMIEVMLNMCHALFFKMAVRFLKEDPWETCRLWRRKVQNTKTFGGGIGLTLDSAGMAQPRELTRLWIQTHQKNCAWDRAFQIVNTRDETTRDFPWVVPMLREEGIELHPAITYGVSPRHTTNTMPALRRTLCRSGSPMELSLKM
jgi:oxaloacetate decarboxylase alpha subunit